MGAGLSRWGENFFGLCCKNGGFGRKIMERGRLPRYFEVRKEGRFSMEWKTHRILKGLIIVSLNIFVIALLYAVVGR